MDFKRGQKVVKLFVIMGIETASLKEVESVKKGIARCYGDEHLKYNSSTGLEIDPAIPGCSSRLIFLEQ